MNQPQSFSKFENVCDILKETWQFLLPLMALSSMELPTFPVKGTFLLLYHGVLFYFLIMKIIFKSEKEQALCNKHQSSHYAKITNITNFL